MFTESEVNFIYWAMGWLIIGGLVAGYAVLMVYVVAWLEWAENNVKWFSRMVRR